MNAKPTHIPETPEVDKYAEKNFEAIALRTKADLEAEAKVNVIFPIRSIHTTTSCTSI